MYSPNSLLSFDLLASYLEEHENKSKHRAKTEILFKYSELQLKIYGYYNFQTKLLSVLPLF